MSYKAEQIAQIRRLHFFEHYSINAVSKVVGLHRDTVKRILYADESGVKRQASRAKLCDPYQNIIDEHLSRYPNIRATALVRILQDRGYKGSVATLRRYLYPLRKKINKNFKPMTVFPGEQAQVDWAHFSKVAVKGGYRKVLLFVAVLSWSRTIFARFSYDQKTDCFLRLHERAFEYFKGVPRQILYDNLKSAVLSRSGSAIEYNPQLLEFSGFYGFEPKACRPYRGNEKGRVERAIRYIRDNFASAYTLTSLDAANEDILQWLNTTAMERLWMNDKQRTVGSAWQEEQKYLLTLQENRRMNPKQNIELKSNKFCLVRFDLNDYSIPWQHTRDQVSLEADDFEVKIYYRQELIAKHKRSWERGQRIINREHWQERRSSHSHGVDQLLHSYPELETFFRTLVDRGESLQVLKTQFNKIRESCNDHVFRKVLKVAKKKEMFHPNQVSRLVQAFSGNIVQARSVQFRADQQDLAQLDITSHSLDNYDDLF